jgi:hypothetical protein
VLVAPASALRGQVALIGQPLVVVEVLSPGNRKFDIGARRPIRKVPRLRHDKTKPIEPTKLFFVLLKRCSARVAGSTRRMAPVRPRDHTRNVNVITVRKDLGLWPSYPFVEGVY